MATLNDKGLTVDRYPEILSDLERRERLYISPDISTRDDEFLGQFNKIISERFASIYELIESVNSNFSLKAEGRNLDDIAALRRLTRIGASKTYGEMYFKGINGIVVPAGSVFANPSSNDRFETQQATRLQTTNCKECEYAVSKILPNTTYTIEVNLISYTYTSSGAPSASEIMNGLKLQMDNDLEKTFTATVVASRLVLVADANTDVSATAVTYLYATYVVCKGFVYAQEYGPIVAPASSITKIVTPLGGITEVYNPFEMVIGRDEETDAELRVRIPSVSSTDSTGTIPSIEASLISNIQGITAAKIIENTLAVPDVDGRPAHSYETVVVGGNNEEVAAEIWRTKPAGIKLHGNTNVIIEDSGGTPRSIDFTRPVSLIFAIEIEYTLYDEEAFPLDGETLIVEKVQEYVNGLGIGVDLIPSRLFGVIYGATEGVDSVTVKIQTLANSGDTPVGGSWQTTRYPISASQFANVSLVDINLIQL